MHTVIIGGGVIGLTTAYHLAREGETVTLVDARDTGLGASDVNAGWIVPADATPVPGPGVVLDAMKWMLRPDSPLYIKPSLRPGFLKFMFGMWRASNAKAQRAGFESHLALAGRTVELFDEYRADGLDYELHHAGLLMAFFEKDHLQHELGYADVMKRHGLEPRTLIGDALREHEPRLSDAVEGGLYFPHELSLDPPAFVAALRAKIAALGVEIVEHAPIDGVQRAADRIVSVSSGSRVFAGDRFLLAAGAWSGPLSRLFEVDIPVRPGKGYCIDTPPVELRGSTMLYDAKVAVNPLSRALRLAGTMEFAGLDEQVNRVRIEAILRAPAKYFRDWEAPSGPLTPKAGMRPMTPDGLPIIGRLPSTDNAYVATGHGMLGVTLAPATAERVTDLIRKDREAPELAPFSPLRFRGTRRSSAVHSRKR